MNRKKLFALTSLLIVTTLLSSCGIWIDFTTYFNTYYNAKTLFDRAEEEILKQKKDVFVFRDDKQTNTQYSTQPVTQYNVQYGSQPQAQYGAQPGVQISSSLSQDLTKVIEKCSKILQYEKNSSYFPDALFITGKAFYYQQEYARAQRKFVELAGLGQTKYSLENKLWLAKTDLQLRSFEEGLKLIDEVKTEALKEGDEEMFNNASITKISFHIFREEFNLAIDECNNYLSISKDDEINALVSFQLGKIYMRLGDKQNALDAFASVLKYAPTFDIEFQSRLEYARLLKELKRIDESEAFLNELRYQSKFKNYLDQVLVELGEIHLDKNRIKPAVEIFREVDSTYKMSPSAGIAQMKLAEIYKKKIMDYDSSYKYYNKAASSLAPQELKLEAGKKSKDLDRYFGLKNELKELNLKVEYINNPTRYLQDSLDYDIAYRQYLDEMRKLSEAQTNPAGFNLNREAADPSLQQKQTLLQNQQKGKQTSLSQQIAQGKYKKPERPKISADSVQTVISQNLYNTASLFFSELEEPDSAVIFFKKILDEYPAKSVKVKTMYALATYYETINDTVKADSLFKFIYDNFENDPMRNAAAQKLGLLKKEETKTVTEKIYDPAEKFYVEAEEKYYNKKYEEAIDSFRSIHKNFPKSPFAPKSIYYIGMIYENDLKMYDSAAVAYEILTKDFVQFPITGKVFAKYTEYKNEKERIKREAEARQKESAKDGEEKQKEAKLNEAQQTALKQQQIQSASLRTKDETGKPSEPKAQPVVKDSTVERDSIRVRPARQSYLQRLKADSDTTKKKIQRPD
ncbi:MAG: tetratricopeptide repeat protein [Bacteroidota bacterium]